jgi:eukaryotic-like serine/threonine-protein kinase
LTYLTKRWPIAMLFGLAVLPQIVSSIVNIAYNTVEIQLNVEQQTVFQRVVLAYNLILYPIGVGIMLRLVVPVVRSWRRIGESGAMTGDDVDQLRRRALRLGPAGIALTAACWLPGGLVFPLAIDAAAGPLAWQVYAHFILSFTLSGLIATIYSHFGIQFIVLRVFYSQLGNADRYSRSAVRAELDWASRWFAPFQSLAAVVPLAGAALIVMTVGDLTLSFRLLMTTLIVVGMFGVGIAVSAARQLNEIVRILAGEATAVN